jgi:hypothetical protein
VSAEGSQPAKGARPERRGIATALLVAAAVLTFLWALASWADRQLLDTDEWTKTSSEMLESPEIRDALATYMIDELYANVDVEAELRAALPPETQGLAGPAAGGLREFAQRAAERALAGPRFQALWEELNRAAHQRFVAIVEGKSTDTVSTTGGEVTIQLAPLVERVGERIGLSGLAEKLPPDAGELVVLKSDQLETAQDIADLLQKFVIIALVLGVGCYALAIYLSHGRRRETLRAVGLIFAIVGILLLILRSVAGGIVTDELAKTAAVEGAATDVWEIGTSLLADIANNLIVNGIIILIAAWVAGFTRPAVALRRASAAYMRDRPGIVYAVVGLIFLILVAWGPTRAFRLPLSLLIIAGLLALGTEALRRQTLREFPHAALAEGEGLGHAWGRMRDSVSQRVSSARAPRAEAAVAPEDAQLERLERLAGLHERGVLSDEEFEAQKSRLLS